MVFEVVWSYALSGNGGLDCQQIMVLWYCMGMVRLLCCWINVTSYKLRLQDSRAIAVLDLSSHVHL